MRTRKKRKAQLIPLVIGNDPLLHKYESLQQALEASIENIAKLIRAGEDRQIINEEQAFDVEKSLNELIAKSKSA